MSLKRITDAQLRTFYLTPEMEAYFLKKLGGNFSPDEIQTQITELLKGLSLYHNCAGSIPFSDEIDDVWHLWILQTRQYAEFCKKLPGKEFLHHNSFDYGGAPTAMDDAQEVERLLSFFTSYVYNFGPLQESVMKYWPTAQVLQEAQEFSMQEFNDYLEDLAKENIRR